jgi:hypothetical protein
VGAPVSHVASEAGTNMAHGVQQPASMPRLRSLIVALGLAVLVAVLLWERVPTVA